VPIVDIPEVLAVVSEDVAEVDVNVVVFFCVSVVVVDRGVDVVELEEELELDELEVE
jgi:hypothetical protein